MDTESVPGLLSYHLCLSACLSVCPSLQSIRILLDHGADPTIKDKEGFAPAELARECGHPQAAAFLAQYQPPQQIKVHGRNDVVELCA